MEAQQKILIEFKNKQQNDIEKLTIGVPLTPRYKPEDTLTKVVTFGDQNNPITQEWPTKEQLKQLPNDKKVKLNRINYKIHGRIHSLTGIQLGFTNGVTTDLLESLHGHYGKL